MIVVDSSVWIDSLRRLRTPAVHTLQTVVPPEDVLLGDIVLLEVLQGARDHQHAARIEQNLRRFECQAMLDPHLAVAAARNSRLLRSAGVTVRKTVDLIIATFCIARGHAILHNDRDYDLIARVLPLRVADTGDTVEAGVEDRR